MRSRTIVPRPVALAFVALPVAALLLSGPARADAVADFYKGKNLSLVVGFSPGGGADLFGRFFARHLGKHIPGNPNVIVQNVPGAGGLAAVNQVYNIAPKDGTTITTMTSTIAIDPLLGNKNARFETLKFNWLGNLTKDPPACLAAARAKVSSIAEAREREIIFGATGPSALSAQHPIALGKIFGFKIKTITGYGGTAQVRVALESGEADAVCAIYASQALGALQSDIETGKLVPIVQMGAKPNPIFGKAPIVYDLARNDEERRVARFVFGLAELSRPFAAPPGVPADRVAALRKAFWDAATSPELKADAERQKLIVDPMSWQDTIEVFREVLDAPKDIVTRANAAMRN